ncbi:MAG: M28 family peptidase [Gemmatimonas sp.]
MSRTPSALAATVALGILAVTPALAQTKPAAASAKPTAGKVVWPDEGPRTWAPRPTTSEITANDLRTRLYAFSDDSMAGRKIGEPMNYKGTAYIAGEFKRFGLKPAGDDGTYFQNLPYGPIGYDSAAIKLAVGSTSLKVRADFVPIAPAANNGVNGKGDFSGVQTVFAGRLGEPQPLDPLVFKGKVAVFLAALPTGGGNGRGGGGATPSCDSVPNKFGAFNAAAVEQAVRDATAAGRGGNAGGGRGGAAGGGRGAGGNGRGGGAPPDTRAQTAGAVGMLVIGLDDLTPAAITQLLGGRMGMQNTLAASGPGSIGSANISRPVAQQIFGKPLDQLAAGATGQPISGSWTYEWKMSKTPARNVIAILPGSNPAMAAEYVLVGAHNDHVGTNAASVDHDSLRALNWVTRPQGSNDPACRPNAAQQTKIDSLIKYARSIRPPRKDSIMNGADDDGSGTVVLLEIAEKFVSEKPARSIIFVSHQGEEAGLLGSRWFTDHPTVPLKSIVAAHNMDMLGKGRADQVKFGGPNSVQTLGSRRLSRDFGDIIDSVNATRSEPMVIDKSWDVVANPMNRFCRSDQVNYVFHEVPVTYFSLGYALDYHQPTDEPQYIQYDHTARLARFIHDVMMAIAMRKDRPAISGADPAFPACRLG